MGGDPQELRSQVGIGIGVAVTSNDVLGPFRRFITRRFQVRSEFRKIGTSRESFLT